MNSLKTSSLLHDIYNKFIKKFNKLPVITSEQNLIDVFISNNVINQIKYL